MIQVLGVPFDLCGPHHGSRLGHLALELAGLHPALRNIGVETSTRLVIPVDGELPGTRSECDALALSAYAHTRDAVNESISNGHTPMVVGGDHSLSIGSISGAIQAFGSDLAVLWIDAHMDANTAETSPSGNLHGVPLGVLTKLPLSTPLEKHDQDKKPWIHELYDLWPRLVDMVPHDGLSKGKVFWLGLRDVDPGENDNLDRLPGSVALTMRDVDELGLDRCIEKFHTWLGTVRPKAIWVSFDVDVLDPFFAPGTGTAVRGGLTYREGHTLAEALHDLFQRPGAPKLAGLDVVEINPLRDRDNETAAFVVEWIASFLGKSILHGRESMI
ncbi:MAG: arginase [Chthonomonadaceae bacterium]|nr:arginase [Chthonomonadaceae bacterium]